MNDVLLTPIRLSQLELLIENSVEKALTKQRLSYQSSPTDVADQLMTVHETAFLLGKKTNTIYTLVSKGLIPVMKQGNRLYFSRNEIMDFVKAGRKLTVADTAAMAGAYLQNKKGGKL